MISRKETYKRKRRRQKALSVRRIWMISTLFTIGLGIAIFFIFYNGDATSMDEDHGMNVENNPVEDVASGDSNHGNVSDGDVNHHDEEGAMASSDEANVTIRFVGDVMLSGNAGLQVETHGLTYPFQHIQSYLNDADIMVGNLESPITDAQTAEDKEWVYRTLPDHLDVFADAGFDIFNLANNHILDYGEAGMQDTIELLQEKGIVSIGAGNNQEEAFQPQFIERNGIKVAFLGFSLVVPEVSWKANKYHGGVASAYDYTLPVQSIEQANELADLVIVYAHWGDVWETKPNQVQQEMAKRYIDAGADLVIGSHPHVLQGIEQYDGKWVAYSLGNFLYTTNPERPETLESVVLTATCTKEGVCDLNVLPVSTTNTQPKPLEGEQKTEVWNKLINMSSETIMNQVTLQE